MKKTNKITSTKTALISSVLALLLCCSMLIGTTFAWFTQTVSSEGNIIQTGKLKVGFLWADGTEDPANASWTDASEGAIFDYANWEPGYSVARHLKVTNEGTLDLNYRMRIVANGIVSKLADVIDVYYFAEDEALVRNDIENAEYLGTLTQVLGTDKNLSKKVNGSIKVGEPADIHTIVLKMQESAGNEYQAMDLGCTFSVELIATQMSSESDSFDNKYDEETKVPDPSIPAALVRPLDDLSISYTTSFPNGNPVYTGDLDVAYQFEPTVSYEDVVKSEYRYYHADFVVVADKDVPGDSMALAGYYSLFCDDFNNGNWVMLSTSDTITAGTEVRLVEGMANGSISVNWEEICRYGNDGKGFQCGAVDLTGVNAGTTITVELRIYETTKAWDDTSGTANTETGEYITVGTFKYTFAAEVSSVDEIASAIEKGGSNIILVDDIAADSAISIPAGSDVTLDLNGYTITSLNTEAKASCAINNKGTLTLKNGTVTYEGVGDPSFGYGTNTINNTGKLVIDGATVINTTNSGSSVAIDCAAGAELIINSGEIVSNKNAIRLCPFGAADINCTINGGTITGARAIQIQLPSNKPSDAPVINLTINGGTFNGNGGLSIYSYSAGQSFANVSVTITDGVFNNDVAFGGGSAKTTKENVSITGGTFNGYLGRYVEDDGTNDGWEDIAKP